MKTLSIGVLGLAFLIGSGSCSNAGVMTSISSPSATTNVDYSGAINFTGAGSLNGSISQYTALNLNSSSGFNYNSNFDNGTGAERFVELYTNNTSNSITSLTVTLSQTGNASAGIQTSGFSPKTVDVTNPTGANSMNPTVTVDTAESTYSVISGNTIRLNFTAPLTAGSSIDFYILTSGLTTPTSGYNTFTLTEVAVATPEPATLVMGAGASPSRSAPACSAASLDGRSTRPDTRIDGSTKESGPSPHPIRSR